MRADPCSGYTEDPAILGAYGLWAPMVARGGHIYRFSKCTQGGPWQKRDSVFEDCLRPASIRALCSRGGGGGGGGTYGLKLGSRGEPGTRVDSGRGTCSHEGPSSQSACGWRTSPARAEAWSRRGPELFTHPGCCPVCSYVYPGRPAIHVTCVYPWPGNTRSQVDGLNTRTTREPGVPSSRLYLSPGCTRAPAIPGNRVCAGPKRCSFGFRFRGDLWFLG